MLLAQNVLLLSRYVCPKVWPYIPLQNNIRVLYVRYGKK